MRLHVPRFLPALPPADRARAAYGLLLAAILIAFYVLIIAGNTDGFN